MAKKKQEYSTESVDEMVERLKRSIESAEHTESEESDPGADDEAFAKMLVEMFGKQGKGKPAAEGLRTELYSAEDFMTDEDGEDDEGDEFVESDGALDVTDDVADMEVPTLDAEQIKEQIKMTAQTQIEQQLRREQEQDSESVPEEELPWFDDAQLDLEPDDEDAAEIAEYEALVAQDEMEQLLEQQEGLLEDEELFEEEDDELFEEEDDEFFEEEDDEFFEEEDDELLENDEPIEDEPIEDEPIEDEPIEDDEPEGEAYIEDESSDPPAPSADYVEMLFDSLADWKQSVAAAKAQTRAERQADERAAAQRARAAAQAEVKPHAEGGAEQMQAAKPVQEAANAEVKHTEAGKTPVQKASTELPAYPAEDPMQGRVAKPLQLSAVDMDRSVPFEEQDVYTAKALSDPPKRKARGRKNAAFGCFAWRGKEYMAQSDEAEIKQAYSREKPWVIARLAICAVMLFSLIALDNAYLLGYLQGSVPAIITTSVYPLVAVAAVLIASAFFFRRLWGGLRSLLTRTPDLYAIPAVMLILALLHDVLLCCLDGNQYMMFNSLAVLALTLCAIADVLALYTQERNFLLVCSGKQRYGVEKVADAAAISRLPVTEQDAEQPVRAGAYRVRELSLVSGYFRRTSAKQDRRFWLLIVYGVALACAVVTAVVSYFATGQGMSALNAFMIGVMGVMPLSMLLFGAIPYFVVGRTLASSGCAVIGTEAAAEYRDAEALLFDAGQMFTAYGSSQITVRGDSDIGVYMDKTRVLLNALGGTLADLAGEAQPSDPTDVKIEMMSVAENGLTLYMNGITCVMMGDYDYLAARGVRLPRRENETNYKKRKNSAVVYIAFDGVFRVGYSVDYDMRREFLLRAKQLQAEGIDPVIVTYDPCINQETLSVRAKDSGIAVERQKTYEDARPRVLDCGVIATRTPEDVLLPLLACKKLRWVRVCSVVLRCAYLALTAAVVLLGVLGSISYAWPLLLLLYQVLWLPVIPVVCTGLLGDLRNKT